MSGTVDGWLAAWLIRRESASHNEGRGMEDKIGVLGENARRLTLQQLSYTVNF